jgi:hypothetical protein
MLNYSDWGFRNIRHVIDVVNQLLDANFPLRHTVTEQHLKFLFLNTTARSTSAMFPGYVDDQGYTHCYWSGTDSFNTYIQNINDPVKKAELETAGWLEQDGSGKLAQSIDYRLNSYGFRCDHFDQREGIAFFGCSFTHGVGLHEHQTWAHRVAQHYDTECWNLAMPGQGLSPAVFYALHYLDEDLPNLKAIAVLDPPPGRLPIYSLLPNRDGMVLHNLLLILEQHADSSSDLKLINFLSDCLTPTTEIERRKNIKALQLIAKSRNIPFVISHATDHWHNTFCNKDNTCFTPNARDAQHYGPDWQAVVADAMIRQLDKYLV